MKRLTNGDIEKLQSNDIDPHDLKPNSKYDLFKDKNGEVFVKPKSWSGPAGSAEVAAFGLPLRFVYWQ